MQLFESSFVPLRRLKISHTCGRIGIYPADFNIKYRHRASFIDTGEGRLHVQLIQNELPEIVDTSVVDEVLS
jgi:hypothetical protein